MRTKKKKKPKPHNNQTTRAGKPESSATSRREKGNKEIVLSELEVGRTGGSLGRYMRSRVFRGKGKRGGRGV